MMGRDRRDADRSLLVNEIIGWVVHPIYANNGEVSELIAI